MRCWSFVEQGMSLLYCTFIVYVGNRRERISCKKQFSSGRIYEDLRWIHSEDEETAVCRTVSDETARIVPPLSRLMWCWCPGVCKFISSSFSPRSHNYKYVHTSHKMDRQNCGRDGKGRPELHSNEGSRWSSMALTQPRLQYDLFKMNISCRTGRGPESNLWLIHAEK